MKISYILYILCFIWFIPAIISCHQPGGTVSILIYFPLLIGNLLFATNILLLECYQEFKLSKKALIVYTVLTIVPSIFSVIIVCGWLFLILIYFCGMGLGHLLNLVWYLTFLFVCNLGHVSLNIYHILASTLYNHRQTYLPVRVFHKN